MGSIQTELSLLQKAPLFPPDPIFGLTKQYLADGSPNKILLGGGTYRDEKGQPWVLPSVGLAEEAVRGSGHEHLPIAGLQSFRDRAAELILHGTQALKGGRIASCQSLSGTGALFLAGAALREIDPSPRDLLLTSPTWANHKRIFESLGFVVKDLPYYKNQRFDLDSYLGALDSSRPGSIVILHACAHNPTGCDPTREQWKRIAAVVEAKSLFPIFDSAYLGFKSGDVDADSWAIRYFVEDLGLEAGICVSFSKNMGLYGERIGLVAFVTRDSSLTQNVVTVLERVQRATVSTPPLYGAKLVSTILGTSEIKSQWEKDIITMSSRILAVRQKLHQRLLELQTPGDWSHIIAQEGMFSYLGLSPTQVAHIRDEYHIYMLGSSRIALTGLNDGNLEYVAQCVDKAVRQIE